MKKFKYPRTYHLPWSLGSTNDDKFLDNTDSFNGMSIVVTKKMDGENFSGYNDGFHARSLDSRHHPSRNWVKTFWKTVQHDIPEGMRVCGENLYAKHSIQYDNLNSFLLGFSVWKDEMCLSWYDTLTWFSLLGIEPVEVIYEGIFDEQILKDLALNLDPIKDEGYVIRNKGSFLYENFSQNVAKYVRKNHVQTTEHWMTQKIIPNKMKLV